MRLGMFTACLPGWSLDRIAAWASLAGYEALEVAVWPSTGGRDFEAAHLPITDFGSGQVEATQGCLTNIRFTYRHWVITRTICTRIGSVDRRLRNIYVVLSTQLAPCMSPMLGRSLAVTQGGPLWKTNGRLRLCYHRSWTTLASAALS
jgi:hypothetical protein